MVPVMTTVSLEELPLRNGNDVITIRAAVRARAVEAGFSLVEQTKIVTAASEIARNTVDYGSGGRAVLELLNDGARRGVRITFQDEGPGIADVELAMRDGYTTGTGLGLGLGGAKRLVSEFEISSHVGKGTRVTLTRWKL